MAIEKTEISIWLFIILIVVLGFVIGLIMSFLPSSKNTSNYKEDNETDSYDFDFD